MFLLVTIAGLVLSGIAWRKKGARSGIRGIAWSLLPIAAWLTHALGLIGRIVSAIVQFAGSFVFLARAYWLGVILVALAWCCSWSRAGYRSSGGASTARTRRRAFGRRQVPSGGDQIPRQGSSAPPNQDDDLSDVQDILKRHGIS